MLCCQPKTIFQEHDSRNSRRNSNETTMSNISQIIILYQAKVRLYQTLKGKEEKKSKVN